MSKSRNKADAALYREYGRTMCEVQTFELNVRSLMLTRAAIDLPDNATLDKEGSDLIDRYFKRPLAKLAKQLGVDEEFADELQAAVNTRNTLAHDYFPTTFLEINTGISNHREKIAVLADARARYEAVNARWDVTADLENAAAGIRPEDLEASQEEMRRMLLDDEV